MHFGLPVWMTITLAPFVTAIFTLAIGYPGLQVKGHYFAFVTSAMFAGLTGALYAARDCRAAGCDPRHAATADMMTLTAAETDTLARTRDFAAQVVAPQAAALGLTAIKVPVADGGRGHSYALKAATSEVLAASDFGFAMSLVNTHKLSQCAASAVKTKYLPALLDGCQTACTALTEKTSGSDFAAIEMRATKLEGACRRSGCIAHRRWRLRHGAGRNRSGGWPRSTLGI
ncbi:acyl-CoA dehydrogenase family protein [Pseudorhodobacter aquimaris]|uniref:acyl-CoA dehydrogenase family protein n=1 Tax=Pseudorhodobacter aquimaris TaxID=687412 RepID=UPI001E4035DD|nr:acyl-CoA dehydrogenase family protein [Pseudorhodobacter aquimaris]